MQLPFTPPILVSTILGRLHPSKPRPQFTIRKPDPLVRGVQWAKLRGNETRLVTDFLKDLQLGHPVNKLVTPELASALLIALNWDNPREFRLNHMLLLAMAMRDKKWSENSDSLCITANKDSLLNGQHTLMAIEISKEPQTLTVKVLANGSGIDQGLKRQSFEVLRIPRNVCSTARSMNEIVKKFRGATPYELQREIYASYKDEIDFSIEHSTTKLGGIIKIATFAYCLGQLKNEPAHVKSLKEFIKQVDKGQELIATDIAYKVREWLRSGIVSGMHSNNLLIFYKLCNAAQAYILDKPIARIPSTPAGSVWFKNIDPAKALVFKDLTWNP